MSPSKPRVSSRPRAFQNHYGGLSSRRSPYTLPLRPWGRRGSGGGQGAAGVGHAAPLVCPDQLLPPRGHFHWLSRFSLISIALYKEREWEEPRRYFAQP